jgi:hypothetical protein
VFFVFFGCYLVAIVEVKLKAVTGGLCGCGLYII